MKHLSKIFILFLIVVMLTGILPVDAAAANTLTPSTTSLSLYKGEKQTISLKWNGKALKAKSAKWKSSKKTVATVDKNGKVTAKKAGTAKITATYKKIKATITVKVLNPSVSAKLNSNKVSLDKGKTYTLKLSQVTKARKTTTKSIAAKNVKWTTSNKKVATVSKGKITAKGYGTATITGTYSKAKATCVVTVQNPNATVKKTEQHTHTFKTITTKATCTSQGKTVVQCSSCGAVSSSQMIAQSPHSYKVSITRQPSVGEAGVKTYTCSGCGNSYTESIPALEPQTESPETEYTACQHEFVTNETPATCLTNGKKTISCKLCGFVTSETVISMLSHSYEGSVTKQPTTTETGIKTYTCSGCGDSYTDTIPCLEPETEKETESSAEKETEASPSVTCEHQYVTTEKKATCSSEGLYYVVCEKCGNVLANDVLPKTAHSLVTKETAATCLKDGEKIIYCKDCDYVDFTETYSATGHNYQVEITKKATTKETGLQTYTCSVCGDSYTKTIPVVDTATCQHHYITQITPATCTTIGRETILCEMCGNVKSSKATPLLAHTYETVMREATCSWGGYEVKRCTVCGKIGGSTKVADPLPHTPVTKVIYEPTCTYTGLSETRCQVCNGWIKKETIPELGHSFGEMKVVQEPACEMKGIKQSFCEVCGQAGEKEYIPALAHSYVTVLKQAATCSYTGCEQDICQICGAQKELKSIAKLPHTYETKVIKEPTCHSYGQKGSICTVCGYIKDAEELPMTDDHTYVVTATKDTSCKDAGYVESTCEKCGHRKTELIARLPHDPEAKISPKPTCTKTGTKSFYCKVCGRWLSNVELDCIPHSYVEEVTQEPTCWREGKKVTKCEYCKEIQSEETLEKLPHDYKEEIISEATGRLSGTKKFTCSACRDSYTETIPQLDVKMQSLTISPASSTTLTSKDSYVRLYNSYLPSDTTNEKLTWSSSNTSVAVVTLNGGGVFVDPVANGTAVITATAADGSGVTATCTVTVEFPDPNVIYIAGGELIPTKTWIHAEDLPEGMDISNVTYEVQDSAGVLAEYGGSLVDDIGGYAMYSGYGARIGTAKLIAKHGNTILRVFTIHVTSNWDKYIGYRNWMKNLEAEIWDSSMDTAEKLVAACQYIRSNFTYNIYSPLYTSYQTKEADCITATNILCDMAKLDLGLKVGYVNKGTKQIYSYLTGAISAADAHVYSAIYFNGKDGLMWYSFDACPRREITGYSY